MRLIRRNRSASSGAFIVHALGVAIFWRPHPYGYAQTNLLHRFRTSSVEHWLGTVLGRDLADRIIYGTRVSLMLPGATLGIVLGTLIGVTSAFLGAAMIWVCSALSMPGSPSPTCCSCSPSSPCWALDCLMSWRCWG